MKYLFLTILVGGMLAASCTQGKKSQSAKNNTTKSSSGTSTAANSNEVSTGIAWTKSDRLAPVLENAQKLKKPVFLEFYATWCGPCKVMDREVFKKPEVYNYLNQHFISYHVDVDDTNGRAISEIYEVTGMPTVVFVDPQGVVLERELGLITMDRFKKVAASALSKMK
jgi:thiol:disulfide interchange protein